MSVEVAGFGTRKGVLAHLTCVADVVCRNGDVCCFPAPAHQPFWVLVLLKKLVAEMYVHRALKNLGMKVVLRLYWFSSTYEGCPECSFTT